MEYLKHFKNLVALYIGIVVGFDLFAFIWAFSGQRLDTTVYHVIVLISWLEGLFFILPLFITLNIAFLVRLVKPFKFNILFVSISGLIFGLIASFLDDINFSTVNVFLDFFGVSRASIIGLIPEILMFAIEYFILLFVLAGIFTWFYKSKKTKRKRK